MLAQDRVFKFPGATADIQDLVGRTKIEGPLQETQGSREVPSPSLIIAAGSPVIRRDFVVYGKIHHRDTESAQVNI